jgi:ATP-binding cassette subfamily C (CFTR/MRP) protein 10
LSKDTYSVDENLPFILNIFLKDFADVIGSLCIIFYENKYILLLLFPLSYVYFQLQELYRPTSRHLKRFDAVSQSPMLTMFTQTIDGLTIFRMLKIKKSKP